MPMLALMPWLRIREPVRIGPFHIFPIGIGETEPAGVTSIVSSQAIEKVQSQYRLAPHLPLDLLTAVQYDGRPLGCEFDEVDRAAIFRFAQHVAISGLSDRRFLGGFPDDYTAAGHYQLVVQAFQEPYRGSVSITHRRKGGQMSVLNGESDFHFVVPAHLVGQGAPNLNVPLLNALWEARALPEADREHVDASVAQFLLSNSDSPDVPPDVETAAAYSALERLIDDHDVAKVRRGLQNLLAVIDATPNAQEARHELPAFDVTRPVFSRWVTQLYSVRGRLAHGKSANGYKSDWSLFEHGVAAAFAYPLLLKALLAKYGLYKLTDEDVVHALGLEGLLNDRPFFAVPTGPNEFEHDRRERSGWVRQFKAINHVLLGMGLRGDIRGAINKLKQDGVIGNDDAAVDDASSVQ